MNTASNYYINEQTEIINNEGNNNNENRETETEPNNKK